MKDYTGYRTRKLTVLSKTDKRSKYGGNIIWLCRCDCGNLVEVSSGNLKSGHKKSCGCLGFRKDSEDLSNKRFDSLIVLRATNDRANNDGSVIWECECECGNICYRSTSVLKVSTNNSCGCQRIKSRGEEKISNLLIDNNIIFESEKTFESCRYNNGSRLCRFDFYVNNKYLIEYDGIQHFEESLFTSNLQEAQERDNFKNQWCKENNIPLIRIPYTHLDDLCLEDLLLETSNFLII